MASPSPAPITEAEILDNAWLTAQLFAAHPGVNVMAHELIERLGPTATKLRLRLTLSGDAGDLPREVCIKAMLGEFGTRGGASQEARFYRELAKPLAAAGVITPPCHHTGIDENADRGLFTMTDLVPLGARFLSALTPYSAEQARLSLDQLARLHAATWNLPPPYNAAWLPARLERMAARPMLPHETLQELFDGSRSAGLPAGIANARRLHAALGKLAERFIDRAVCLVHGDAHAGNLYELDGQIGLIDWQLVQHGCWAQDVAYHIAAALSPETRRASEHELLDHYRERLAAHGGPGLDSAQAWQDYRAAMVYGYYLWGITRRVDPPAIKEFNLRLGLAVAELESYDLLEV